HYQPSGSCGNTLFHVRPLTLSGLQSNPRELRIYQVQKKGLSPEGDRPGFYSQVFPIHFSGGCLRE
ncbi:MAG: hypothetical protein ABIJ86_16820, partial [Spirochaetota bacterium]